VEISSHLNTRGGGVPITRASHLVVDSILIFCPVALAECMIMTMLVLLTGLSSNSFLVRE